MKRSYVLRMARKLRDDYSGEIPAEILDSVSDTRGYKCRSAWFTAVCNMTDNAIAAGVVGDKVGEAYDGLQDYFGVTGFHDRLTVPVDIACADNLLDLVIDECSVKESLRRVFFKVGHGSGKR